MVPATRLARAPILIASYSAIASLLLTSPTSSEESPRRSAALNPSSAGSSVSTLVITLLDFSLSMLYPSSRSCGTGISSVSSRVTILIFGIIWTMHDDRKDVLPLDLVPAINIVLEPSIRNHRSPAENESIIRFFMKRGNVHGLSLWRLNAKPRPSGESVLVIAATLARPPGTSSSVSRTGLASSNGLPLLSLNLVAHDSASSWLGTMLVSHSWKSE